VTTPTVDQTVSPLLDARQDLASAIETDTGYTCHDSYTKAFATPCYMLAGNGHTGMRTTAQGIGVALYTIRVYALFGPETEAANQVEELARLAVVACFDAGLNVPTVPAPGLFTVGDREYAGVQFDVEYAVTLRGN